MNTEASAIPTVTSLAERSVVVRMAERYGIDAGKMMTTLKATAFKGEVSNEQMMALLVVAEQHGLNPWTKEIYAFPSRQGIVPMVSIDGWIRIINSRPELASIEFEYAADNEWVACVIARKDREKPVVIREYLRECKRDTTIHGNRCRSGCCGTKR